MEQDKRIQLLVDGEAVDFDVSLSAYNAYVNAMTPNNKVAPSHNFLMRVVCDEDRETLKAFLALPGAALDIVGALLEEYQPQLNVVVGKPSA